MRRGIVIIGAAVLCLIGFSSLAGAAPSVSLSTANIAQGQSGTLTLNLSGGTGSYAGVNATFDLPVGVSLVSVMPGPLTPGAFSIYSHKVLANGRERVAVIAYSGSAAFSGQSGALLNIAVQVAATAPSGNQPVTFVTNGSGLSNADGSVSVSHSRSNGAITIGTGTCTYSISDTHSGVGASAGTGSIVVTAGTGCAWTAQSNSAWLTITPPNSGTGNGTVNYAYTANQGSNSREGSLTIADKTFTLTQAASGPPDIALGSSQIDFGPVHIGSAASVPLAISNMGDAALTVNSTSITGTNAALFSLTKGTCPSLGPTLGGGESCQWTVGFHPRTIGAKLASLAVGSNDPNENPLTVALSGTAVMCPVAFADVAEDHWAGLYIKTLYCNAITTGCGADPLRYCPTNNITRQAMAALIIRALFGEDFTYTLTPYFTDVPATNPMFKYIQKMRDEEITTGYPDGTYKPLGVVSRAQMATVLVRSLYGEAFQYTQAPHFADVPAGNSMFKYIQKMKDDGMTTGCNAPANTMYCPGNLVNRASMAAFIGRAFLGMQ